MRDGRSLSAAGGPPEVASRPVGAELADPADDDVGDGER
jgi:hypothetical protein